MEEGEKGEGIWSATRRRKGRAEKEKDEGGE
jgi:hypothetical protein